MEELKSDSSHGFLLGMAVGLKPGTLSITAILDAVQGQAVLVAKP